MAEIKLFNEWLETHEISPPAIALWHGLMYIAWRSEWKPELNISVSRLTFLTKLSRSAFYRERESLRQHGLIEFDSNTGSQSATYRIIGFEEKFASHIGTQTETQPDFASHIGTQTGAQPESASHIGMQSGTQNEKTTEVVSHIGTQNPAKVPSKADLTVGKNEKSPIYINKYKDIDKGGCGGKKKNDDAKSKSPKKKKPEFDLSFIGDEAWEALVSSWLEYKRSRNESYKSDMSVKKFHTMLRNLSRGDPAAARRIIDKSIANNWAGIFELTDTAAKSRGQPATGQRIGQIKQPEDEERRRKLLEKFGAGKKPDDDSVKK